ncbi:glycosyltransferase family 2 protein [Rothia aerolata]|uniref:Glycosyltransferase 2-like domain-containing protein n=1 Tax=Rothia aerolata TaxID=1812262 RepID=A0A917IZ68_9MICC|nr:glycosyltransferase family 2 protein [Rothia aerolata]GGH66071.1 hypothetical protein GCM10007359_19940 [Rothia aerolata]
MTTPRTSIIMPVYNTAQDVTRAIDSVLAQTDPDFELIVINDRSPDNADSVISRHLAQKSDPRVRYILNEENLGLAATRNRGIAEARGQWLAYLDSDDAFQPNFLETMHAYATEGIDVVTCAHDVVYPDGERRFRLRGETGELSGHEAMLRLLRDETTPYVWDKIFRRDVVEGLEFIEVNRAEDAVYTVTAYRQVRAVRFIDDSLVLYSVNPQSITWGSVPPVGEMYRFVELLKEATGAHQGNAAEQKALATYWVLAFLNGAQSALRLNPENLDSYLLECRDALRWPLLVKTLQVRPFFGAAGVLLRLSPSLYKLLYGAYVKKMYGL